MTADANGADIAPAVLHVRKDAPLGIIHVFGNGDWPSAVVGEALDTVQRLRQDHAERGEIALILIDMRRAKVDQSQLAARIMHEAQHSDHGCHRIAVLVDSSLIKMEMKQAAPYLSAEFFLSPHAATTWLTAYRRC